MLQRRVFGPVFAAFVAHGVHPMTTTMETMHTHERVLIGAALVGIATLAWAYFLVPVTGGGMNGSMAMPVSATSLNMLAANVTMWAVMMVAMMLPGASPMILTFARVRRQRALQGGAMVSTWVFVAGYLSV